MLGSASLLTALIPEGTVEAQTLLDWSVDYRDVPESFVGVSVSADKGGSGVVLPPEPGQPRGGIATNAIVGTRVLGASIMRFPDDISQSYHWQPALGTSMMDIDRFAFLADQAQVPEMMITVNMMDGASDEATNWVAYANSPAGTQFGRIRTENGHQEPFAVRYWLLGEDITDRPDVFPSALTYLDAASANATAMKAVSPEISIGLWISPGETEVDRAWNEALLDGLRDRDPGQAQTRGSAVIDFLAVAVSVEVPNRPLTDATLFSSLYGYAAERARAVLEAAEHTNHQSLRNPLPIAVYRYELQFPEEGWNQDKGDSLGATVALGGMLNEFMRHDGLFTAIYKGLNSDSYAAVLKVPARYDLPAADQFSLNPVGEILASFGQYLSGRSIMVEYSGVGATVTDAARAFYRAPPVGRIGLQERVPMVSVASCYDTDVGQMILWVASRSPHDRVLLHVRVQGMGAFELGQTDSEGNVLAILQEVSGPTLATDRYTGFDRVVSRGEEVNLPVESPEPGVFEFELVLEPHTVSTVVFLLA